MKSRDTATPATETFTAEAPFISLEYAARTCTCSTRSLLRAEAQRRIRLSRPFGPGGKIYVARADLEIFFRNGYRQPPDRQRGARLAASRRQITPKVERKNQRRNHPMQPIPP